MGEFIRALKKDLRDCETVHDDDPDPKVYDEAQRQIALLQTSLTSTPAMMERARKLIRYASSMAQSPLCKVRDQREAVEAARRAAESYEEARAAILEGQSWDALKTLRRIGERVALSAAKAARSCSAGQTSLTAMAPEKPARKPRRKPPAPPAPSVVPDGWEPFEEGDRVVFKDVHGMVTRVPARAYGPADKVTFLADGRKRGRRLEARLLVREAAPPEVVEAAD